MYQYAHYCNEYLHIEEEILNMNSIITIENVTYLSFVFQNSTRIITTACSEDDYNKTCSENLANHNWMLLCTCIIFFCSLEFWYWLTDFHCGTGIRAWVDLFAHVITNLYGFKFSKDFVNCVGNGIFQPASSIMVRHDNTINIVVD